MKKFSALFIAAFFLCSSSLAGNNGVSNPINWASPGSIGSTTPAAGAFTTLSASSTVSGTGFSNYLASPPTIGGTTPGVLIGSSLRMKSNGFTSANLIQSDGNDDNTMRVQCGFQNCMKLEAEFDGSQSEFLLIRPAATGFAVKITVDGNDADGDLSISAKGAGAVILQSNTTATTQSANNNTTKLATTAYADRAVIPASLAVGSIIFARNTTAGTINANSTTAAANLTPASISSATGLPVGSGDTLAGTWKALVTCVTLNYCMWQRTS